MNESPQTNGNSPQRQADVPLDQRVRRLETQAGILIEALQVLARGLEEGPLAEPEDDRTARAARRTHELALLARSAPGAPSDPG